MQCTYFSRRWKCVELQVARQCGYHQFESFKKTLGQINGIGHESHFDLLKEEQNGVSDGSLSSRDLYPLSHLTDHVGQQSLTLVGEGCGVAGLCRWFMYGLSEIFCDTLSDHHPADQSYRVQQSISPFLASGSQPNHSSLPELPA